MSVSQVPSSALVWDGVIHQSPVIKWSEGIHYHVVERTNGDWMARAYVQGHPCDTGPFSHRHQAEDFVFLRGQ